MVEAAELRAAAFARLDWSALSAGPRSQGRVELIVCRLAREGRSCPESVELSPEAGVLGDRWAAAARPKRAAQVALINAAVARVIADRERWDLFGDNFVVDFDLREQSAPPGTLLELGSALIEVTAEPHLGCGKFRRRFGSEALAVVNDEARRDLKLRGVYARVVRGGRVALGDLLRRAIVT